MPENPFYVGGPVPAKYFVGRTSEIRTAFDQISKRSHLALYGSPGMGKSSLLRYIASPEVWKEQGRDPSNAIIIYLNCTDINPFTPLGFLQEISRLLYEATEGDTSLQTAISQILQEEIIEKGDVRRILRQIGQRDKFLVLLLDDYDVALHPNDDYTETQMLTFLSEFRNLAVHSSEGYYLSTIVTTFRRLTELGPKLPPGGSPWYNHYLFRLLKPFSPQEVNAKFFSLDSSLFIPASPTLKKGIMEIADGHPALLQNAGYLLYDNLKDGTIPDIEAFTNDFESATEQFFRDTWAFSTEEEQTLLMLVALYRLHGRLNRNSRYDLGDIDLIFSQRIRELFDLEERGVIKRIPNQGRSTYAFSSSMMEWWVIRELENSNEEQLEQREKVFLNMMSRSQAAQVNKAIHWIWEHRDVVQTTIFWIIRNLGGKPI